MLSRRSERIASEAHVIDEYSNTVNMNTRSRAVKRAQPEASSDEDPLQTQEITPRKGGRVPFSSRTADSAQPDTPSSRLRNRLSKQAPQDYEPGAPSLFSPSRKPVSRPLFTTPTKNKAGNSPIVVSGTPSRILNADRSARKKSVRVLVNPNENDGWDGGSKLAQEIWDAQSENSDVVMGEGDDAEEEPNEARDNNEQGQIPSNGRAGRKKATRLPMPEVDLPPHEKYFWENRAGATQTSNNTFSKIPVLTHEEYFENIARVEDPVQEEKEYLSELHERSYPQWNFELREGFSICLHGYGSKRNLVHGFADWLHEFYNIPPTVVMVNGYVSGITMRGVLGTVAAAILGPDTPSKLGSQPADVLDFIQTTLQEDPPARPIMVFVNSIDSAPLRRAQHQAIFARLAALPHIHLLATADTPNLLLLWDIALRDQFNFVFHDCTTFISYDAELDAVEEVHNLIGRKVRRVGGKEGIGFVLKSLPENTRKLYRLLLTEILTLLGDQQASGDEADGDGDTFEDGGEKRGNGTHGAAVEWRALFNKASEEFISSSEMMFRTQLKEFYDHEMITSKIDLGGTELLGVPLSQEDMENVLEDLVLDS